MKKNDEELWVRKMRDSLREYSEPPPPGGWERLQQELEPPVVMVERRIYSYRIWSSVAAVVILAVAGISLYFLNSPVADEIRHAAVPDIAVTPDVLPETIVPEVLSSTTEPVISSRPQLVAQHTSVSTTQTNYEVPIPIGDVEDITNKGDITPEIKEEITGQHNVVKEEPRNKQMSRPSGKDKLHLPKENTKSKKSNNWSLALSVNSTGSSNLEEASGSNRVKGSVEQYKIDLEGNAVDGPVAIPKEAVLYFQDGVPYYMVASEVEYKHHQPITFGASVRKGLTNNISIETGLNYTQLNSDIFRVTGSDKVKQKLHYLGIPVRVNWDFVDSRYFTVYLAGGVIIEKCIYGSIDGEKETVKPIQFSLNGAVGAQYNITKQLGLYIEPGVSYFFDDGSDVQTIRKDTPFNFNLQAGVRFSY